MRSLGRILLLALPFAASAFSQNCTLSATPQNMTAPSSGGTLSVAVTLSNPACYWWVSGTSGSTWITQSWPVTGVFGSGTVSLTVAANPGSGRNASLNLVLFGNPAIVYEVQIIQAGASSPQPFLDVSPSSTYFDYANIIRTAGVTKGCALTPVALFCPDATLTRGQAAASIIRALYTEPFIYTRVPYFDDVPATHPFFAYVQKMKDLGITNGCSATPALFCPDAGTTRLQMATFLIRGKFGSSAVLNQSTVQYFSDVPPSSTGYPFIQKMKDYGITNGCSTTQFCPDATVTRGMMAVFMTRLYLTPFLL